MTMQSIEINEVKEFWEKASCGERLYLKDIHVDSFNQQLNTRYALEPYILDFADFLSYQGKKVLEIGVGLGADHQMFAKGGAELVGIDLTERAVQLVKQRFELFGLESDLRIGNVEKLEFEDNHFDLVYSWGVIHHTSNTAQAAKEILRVLKPGGEFKVMIYNKYSIVGFMLWLRYALLIGKPFRTLGFVYGNYLESPGTKAYTLDEARELFPGAEIMNLKTVLTHGDLLLSQAGQRHTGVLLTLARRVWPRKLINRYFSDNGLFLLIHGRKVG